MTELKTLKDLEKINNPEEGYWINGHDIKQEAIKWVKHDIKLFGKIQGRNVNLKFITFFNITEADLK